MQIRTWKKWQLVLLEFPGKESLLFSLENTIWSLADVVLQYNPVYMQFIYVYLIKARVKGVKLTVIMHSVGIQLEIQKSLLAF